MITWLTWGAFLDLEEDERELLFVSVLCSVVLSIATVPIDIIFSPIEIISLIIYKILERRNK